jgi:putative ABC transport system permease protein
VAEKTFLLSFLLVGFSLVISYMESLRYEKEILFSSVRVFVQLMLLAFLLNYLFNLKELYQMFLALILMSLFASLIASERLRDVEGVLVISLVSITLSSLSTVVLLLVMGILEATPNQLIPFGGLVIGNTLNAITIAMERFSAEVRNRREEIEAKIALGATLREAMGDIIRDSIRAAMIPKLNFLKSAGIVHIPGVAVGMLLAGAKPMEAVLFQMVMLFSILFVALLGGVVCMNLGYKRVLSSAGF